MTDGTDERLFQRYQSHGDVDALAQVFDRTAPALLRLALHLARGPVQAEDLLQETFVAAIETAARHDRTRPLLPWLAGILVNKARWLRWREGRAPDPERVAVPAAADPGSEAEQDELTAAIDAAISELPEAYRAVLRLHLGYGHGPAEIAHALERSPGTVRSQLMRGLELLRKALPVGFAGGALATVGAERGLAAVRAAVLKHAGAHLVPAAVGIGWLGGLLVMKKSLMAAAGLVVAALAGLAAWSALSVQSAGSRAGGASQPVVVAARDPASGEVSASGTAPRVAVPGGVRRSATDQTGEIEVVALDAVTRAPIAGAEIRGTLEPRPEPISGVRYVVWSRQRMAGLGMTGADGTARIAGPPPPILAVRAGERYGEVAGGWSPTGPPARIEVLLAVDRGVRIRSVDTAGKAVPELPIAARVLREFKGRVFASATVLGLADGRGELWVPLRTMLRNELTVTSTVALVPYVPGAWQRGGTVLDLALEPPGAAELVTPALGGLRCELLTQDGEEFGGPTEVRMDDAGPRAAGTQADPDVGSAQFTEHTPDGSIVSWRYFGMGWHGQVWFNRGEGSFRAEGDGPKTAGEIAVLRAQEPPDTCVLVGRLLLADGTPFARRDVELFYRAHVASGAGRVRTDAQGRFRFGLDVRMQDWLLERVMLQPSPTPSEPHPTLACQVLPDRKVGTGRWDLGDLSLAEPATVCTGRLAGAGMDLARVTLRVETAGPGVSKDHAWEDRVGEGVLWSREPDGSFVARGFGLAGPLRLRAHSNQLAEDVLVPFEPGARDVVVTLRSAASLGGTVAAGLDGSSRIELARAGTTPRTTWCGRNEHFSWTGLAAGTYTLRAFVPGDPEPLVTVPDLAVTGGETRDPRLQPLRLDVPLRTVVVRVRRADGTEAGDGVVLVDGGGKDGVGAFGLQAGRAVVRTRRAAIDLWVCANGFAPVPVRGATDAVQVDLRAPRVLQLRFRPPPVSEGFVLMWDFELLAPDARPFNGYGSDSVASRFGHNRRLQPAADGTCQVPLLCTEPARVRCHVQRRNSDYWWEVPVVPATLPPGEGVVDLTATVEALAEAITHLPDRDDQKPYRR